LCSFGIFWVWTEVFRFWVLFSCSLEGGSAAAMLCFGVRRRWFRFPFPATVVVLFAFYASVLVLVGGVSFSGDGGGFVLIPGRALWFCFPFLFGVRICCAKVKVVLVFVYAILGLLFSCSELVLVILLLRRKFVAAAFGCVGFRDLVLDFGETQLDLGVGFVEGRGCLAMRVTLWGGGGLLRSIEMVR
jgi:hypothetical protein